LYRRRSCTHKKSSTLTSLSSERQTELRHPPTPPPDYKNGKCTGGGIGQMVRQTNVTCVRLALTCYMSLRRRSIEPSEAEFKFSIRGGKLIGHTVYCVVDFSARIRVAGLAVYERFGLLSQ